MIGKALTLAVTATALALGASPAAAAVLSYDGTRYTLSGATGEANDLRINYGGDMFGPYIEFDDSYVVTDGGGLGGQNCGPGVDGTSARCDPVANPLVNLGDENDNAQGDISAQGGREEIFGGPGNDRLKGGQGDDLLDGGPGDDELEKGGTDVRGGSDTLVGGDGFDATYYRGDFGGRKIAYTQFVSVSDGIRGDVYVMNADGSGKQKLTDGGGYDPVFSPDGSQIAYQTDGIYLMNADGTNQRRILADRREINAQGTLVEDNSEPTFSPDGRRIAFSRTTHTTIFTCNPFPNCTRQTTTANDVYAMNADASDVRQLTSAAEVEEVDPSFSPDGAKIVYFHWPERGRDPEAGAEEQGSVRAMNADGSGKRTLIRGSNPEWTSVQGGPTRPRVGVSGLPRRCVRRDFTLRVSVKTTAKASLETTVRVDGRLLVKDDRKRGRVRIFARRMRRGRHRIKITVAVGPERRSRTVRFRRC